MPSRKAPDAPTDKALVLRRYQLDNTLLCPMKLKLADQARPMNEAPLFGITFHKLAHLFISDPANRFRLLTTKAIEEIAFDTLMEERSPMDMPPTWPQELSTALLRWIDQWWDVHELELTGARSEATHLKFLRWDGTTDIWIQGTIDLLKADSIVDWKTSAKAWAPAKARSGLQAPLYAWLSGLQLPLDFTFAVYSRSSQEWEEHTVEITQAVVDGALETSRELALMINRKIFPATPFAYTGSYTTGWWCTETYCDVWEACTARHMVPVMAPTPIER